MRSPRPTPPTRRAARGDLKPLAGIPLGIKDLFATEGVDTTAGSNILKGFKPPYESTVTANLRKARRGDARQAQHGRVRDGLVERDQRLRPGDPPVAAQDGSNVGADPGRLLGRLGGGGRGAASRRASTGTDTGGSIRQPAAFTGICGIKPTYGRCSRWGIVAFASSLDQAGPMAQDRPRLRDPARGDGRVRPEGFDLARPAGAAVGSGLVERSQGQARRHSQGISHRRRARRDQRAVGPGHRMAARTRARRRSRSACRTPNMRCRPITSSPRPRPRPTSPAMTASATACASRA